MYRITNIENPIVRPIEEIPHVFYTVKVKAYMTFEMEIPVDEDIDEAVWAEVDAIDPVDLECEYEITGRDVAYSYR